VHTIGRSRVDDGNQDGSDSVQTGDSHGNNFDQDGTEGLQLPPWEQREAFGLLNGLYLTIKNIMLAPGEFFHRMPSQLGMAQPLLFAVIIGVLASFFSWMWTLTGGSLQALLEDNFEAAGRGAAISFVLFLFSPVTVAILVAFKAAIIHGVLMLVGGNRLGFEATFRVSAYSEATAVLALVPFCGGMVAVLWSLAVTIIGLYSIHETEPWKAIVAVLAPMLLCLATTGGALALLVLGLG